ncbi:MAG: flavodoxin [Ruminococcaceae bacterium]|nr:flavodoxin [Oscillospiraceae bacterium]
MKKFTAIILAALLFCTGCSDSNSDRNTHISSDNGSLTSNSRPNHNQAAAPPSENGNSRVLIAYFTVPEDDVDTVARASVVVKDGEKFGNTEYVAHIIQQTVGGDMFPIEAVREYTHDHDALTDFAADEKAEGTRPELKNHIDDISKYDTIILGYPNWWGDLPMPVYTFLEEYDFGAKTIIPFVTHGGSGLSKTKKTISDLQPGAFVSDDALNLSRNDILGNEDTITEWAKSLDINTSAPLLAAPSADGNTVLNAAADPHNSQTLYLWEEGNAPATTEYIVNNGNYFDDPDFRPYVVTFPVPEGTEVKGAVLICAGGAFQFRSDHPEGTPVAEKLSKLGYQSFVVNYRLRPYTQEEGALDLARAVRFVRKNADVYGIDEKDIAVMGFSAGGILAGEMLLNYDSLVNGTALDPSYVTDSLDDISADAGADGMIYSFYGRLSVASTDSDKFAQSDLPPTYFCYGTRDPFVRQFELNVGALRKADVSVEVNVLEDAPHGYGYTQDWIPAYGDWLENIFKNN